jgi:uncharacterized RDD family membrane protein YckC
MNAHPQYAPIWRRFAAIIYDTLLVTAVSMGYGGLGLGLGLLIAGDENALTSSVIFQIGWLIVILSFFCYFWRKAGQTLGMRAWRLRVVTEDNTAFPSMTQCFIRCALAPLGLSLFITALLRQDKRYLHDISSGTCIVLLPKETS